MNSKLNIIKNTGIFLVILFPFLPKPGMGQDSQFSQFYSAPLYLNPGFTGTTPVNRLVFNSRIQWPELPSPFITVATSYDRNLESLNSGVGILVVSEKAGSADMKSNQAGFSYAYKINIPGNWVFSPGILFSFGNRGIDYTKLVFGDQLDFNGPTSDDMLGRFENTFYFDFSSGLLVYNKAFWGGISIYHMNEPNLSMVQEWSRLPKKISVHSGVRIPLNGSVFDKVHDKAISPSFIYKKQGSFEQLDLGLNYIHGPVHMGFWYRGIPLKKNDAGSFDHDALLFTVGLRLRQFDMGYSYDHTLSSLQSGSGGSHEISLVMEFPDNLSNKKRVTRQQKFLPCPAFNWTSRYKKD